MDQKSGSASSKFLSGAPASDYLTSGEVIKWKGKPAAIYVLGRGLLLVALSLIFLASMLVFNADKNDALAIVVALVACAIMILVERRFGLVGGIAGILIALVAAVSSNGLAGYWYIIPLVLALLELLVNYIYLGRVMFLITDRRIITRYGIFTLRYADIGINKIQNVTVIQPWYERILGFGDIYFATAGEKGGIDYESPGIKLMKGGAVSWENVERPFEVNKIASEVVNPPALPVMVVNQNAAQPEDARARYQVSGTSERLKELDELKTRGMVSQAEYDEKRKQILEKL
jgi:uncharacterized membrane protein YdbT with pleckstrin-like domain